MRTSSGEEEAKRQCMTPGKVDCHDMARSNNCNIMFDRIAIAKKFVLVFKKNSMLLIIFDVPIHTNNSGLQVNKDGPGNVLPSPSLAEEGCEGVIVTSDRLVARHLAVRLNSVFQAVEFPAGVPHLDTSLAHVDRDAFTLKGKREGQLRSGWRIPLDQYLKSHVFKIIMPCYNGFKALSVRTRVSDLLRIMAHAGLEVFRFREEISGGSTLIQMLLSTCLTVNSTQMFIKCI